MKLSYVFVLDALDSTVIWSREHEFLGDHVLWWSEKVDIKNVQFLQVFYFHRESLFLERISEHKYHSSISYVIPSSRVTAFICLIQSSLLKPKNKTFCPNLRMLPKRILDHRTQLKTAVWLWS